MNWVYFYIQIILIGTVFGEEIIWIGVFSESESHTLTQTTSK